MQDLLELLSHNGSLLELKYGDHFLYWIDLSEYIKSRLKKSTSIELEYFLAKN